MSEPERPSMESILRSLQERAKELNCLYTIEELIRDPEASADQVFQGAVEALPPGWQFPVICEARITYQGKVFQTPAFQETPWSLKSPIPVQGEIVGTVAVYYTQPMPKFDEGPFLKEERKLIDTIADRLAQWILHRELRGAFETKPRPPEGTPRREEWTIILDLLRRTDRPLLRRLTRRMVNYLGYNGVKEAADLLHRVMAVTGWDTDEPDNRPLQKNPLLESWQLTTETFQLAGRALGQDEVLTLIQKWIKEDRLNFLVDALERPDTSLVEIAEAVERYRHIGVETHELSRATQTGLRVSLIRRLFTDNLQFINSAREFVDVDDFSDLLTHTVLPPKSQGKLGGKSSGMFLAGQILKHEERNNRLLRGIKTPKTWYLPSDVLLYFINYNNLEDIYNWKYTEVGQIRQEYPNLVHVFKNSRFPPEVVNGLSAALDDLEGRPLIVRSSSLLEDQAGSAFSGKYKSLFLANQGAKAERLAALTDAIAEVYASVFGPDPIEYRAERGLLDTHEEMGIMIQEVVGAPVGRYYLPAFAGVAFSHNEFRWSPRIKRDDGLLRLVPGLGTRAVDRLVDDYPVLIAPGQPGLRVNVTPQEVMRYSPRRIDAINLETNSFESVEVRALLREFGHEYPKIHQLVSICDHDDIRKPVGFDLDFSRQQFVISFEGLISGTPFLAQVQAILTTLKQKLGFPVDLEFAHDGQDFYLLQCRPQSSSSQAVTVPIPRDIDPRRVLFTAKRFVSNGRVPEATHIVYVDPERYAAIEAATEMREIGRAVGKLNKLLPKRQFLLIGPGRWGSRGDIKLGVSVTYSDISNTSVLVEVARKKGNYVPDLSFGTHFFQDLVESGIRYLPLYPDDPGIVFNENFLRNSKNTLTDLLPEFAHLSEVLRVIDVARVTEGLILRVLMNADLDEGIGYLSPPAGEGSQAPVEHLPSRAGEEFWRWRHHMAQKIAAQLDPGRFGVKGLYVFGSTKNATAGPGSDIDLLIHFAGDQRQREDLLCWLDGWSRCLAAINYLRTGYKTDGLLDLHLITDQDIAAQNSYALKIGAVTDPARPLPLKGEESLTTGPV